MAKTGSGKTLAFGIPIVERTERAEKQRPRALVLVPTRELALQVTKAIQPLAKTRKLRITTIYGGAPIARQIDAVLKGVDIVIATPGRMIDLMERQVVDVRDVRIVVLDEADHMADLGFLPQVDRILPRIKAKHQTLLFSATLDSMVDTLVRRYMHEPVFHEVASEGVTIETMQHRFIAVHPNEKPKAAAAICGSADKILVFVRTRHRADRVASQLHREGITSGPIHGGLRQSQRESILRDFQNGKVRALVATNVAARGLHVEGIDIVLHYDSPEDDKTYLHRSGRTARAGEAGLVVTFVSTEHIALAVEMREMAGLNHQIVVMKADDERLKDLAGWEPPEVPKKPEPKVRRSRLGHRTSPGKSRRRTRR
jgi:superfamily II DNA/RNA helicase